MDNFENEQKPKQEKPLLQVAIGIITPVLAITIISLLLTYVNNAFALLTSFAIIIFAVFLGVKLFRKNYRIAGIMILAIAAPVLMLGIAAGACTLLLSGGNF